MPLEIGSKKLGPPLVNHVSRGQSGPRLPLSEILGAMVVDVGKVFPDLWGFTG